MERSRAGAFGLSAVAVVAAVALGGCGNGAPPAAADPTASASPAAPAEQAAPTWPDPALTTVTTPKGVREPVGPVDVVLQPEVEWFAGEEGISLEEAAAELQDQQVFSAWAERAQAAAGDRYSALAWGDPEDDTVPPWVGYTGTELPDGLLALAEELPFPVELRGGAVLSDAERERVLSVGIDAFSADVGDRAFSGGGLDAPTGVLSIDYIPDGARKRADDATAALVVDAMVEALGRRAPLAVEFHSDDRDPETTNPATWFLPAGFVPDPAATSVEVLVDEEGCTTGQGAVDNTAPPQVEVTDAQVRIAVSTYIRKGAQGCPGHPLAPLVVELGQPLGDRTLVDVNGALGGGGTPFGGNEVVPAAG
ncbi:hypothetical protein [Quadrisphaera sp. INWT6]|uniref:hypothetical protein n=1 Tax=Quadrisphaera sp. INWT6 TaxID=2596917 RepID=UPI001892259D|nr:hypothetical protein [Quadrisphaera sp. INWT6]